MYIDPFHRMTRLSCLVGVALIVLVVFGCATYKVKMYSGPVIEESKLAVIQAEKRAVGKGVIGILRVDGKLTTNPFTSVFLMDGRLPDEVSILPGKHNIITRFDLGGSHSWTNLWLVAEPGERYIIKAYFEGYQVRMWIENERTGQPTGEITGSDEPKQN